MPCHLISCKPSRLINIDHDESQFGKCHHALGDGNCMFGAIAHQLYGMEEQMTWKSAPLSGVNFTNLIRCIVLPFPSIWIDSVDLGGQE